MFAGDELAAAGFDAGADRSKQRPTGAYESEDGRWIFGRVGAAILRVQRDCDAEQESEAYEQEGGFLH